MASLGKCRTCDGKVSSEAPACPHCGQPEPYLDSAAPSVDGQPASHYRDPEPESYLYDLKQEVLTYLGDGKKIQAIQFVIRSTGWDLVESKRYVELFE